MYQGSPAQLSVSSTTTPQAVVSSDKADLSITSTTGNIEGFEGPEPLAGIFQPSWTGKLDARYGNETLHPLNQYSLNSHFILC
jgi:hypothetical protein